MARVRKALVAGVGAAASAFLAAAVQHGGWPGWAQVGLALGVGVAAGWAVWQVPNAVPPA